MSLFIKREMIEQLIELADQYEHEGAKCADAGAFQAANVMFTIAFEAKLFCAVGMSQHVLEAEAKWPGGDPFKWELGRLVGAARDADWFEPTLEEAVSEINSIRIAAVHPAAYIRDGGYFLSEVELEAIFNALVAADEALGRIVQDLPLPPAEESA